MSSTIGTLNEGHLHASLKEWYIEPGDTVETLVGGYVVDILRGDLVIEVQTANFSRIAAKVRALVSMHPVRIVHPVAQELWLVKLPRDPGDQPSRRRSPLRKSAIDVFDQLVSFPELITHANFQLDVVLTREEELRVFDSRRRWRRRHWATVERRLLEIIETVPLRSPADFMALIPPTLPDEFLTSDLATTIGRPRHLAQKIAYCLRNSGLIEPIGRRGNAVVYAKTPFALEALKHQV